MSVPPFVVGADVLWCFLYNSDRVRERSLHTCIAMCLAIVGLVVMGVSKNNKLRYVRPFSPSLFFSSLE
jgi:hypothetical protein